MQNLKRTLALILIIIGLTGLMTALVSLINPLTINIANDNSANEASLLSGKNLMFLFGYVLFLATGIGLTISDRKQKKD